MKKTFISLTTLCLSLGAVIAIAQTTPPGFTPKTSTINTKKLTLKTTYVPTSHHVTTKKTHKKVTTHHVGHLSIVNRANKKAQRQPKSSQYINAIMTFNYIPGDLYQIYCAPLRVTDIEFQPGEEITSVGAGDTLRWQVSRTYSGTGRNRQEHLLIKPIDTRLTNSMVITTSKRTYHLEMHSANRTYMATVRWAYPGENGFVQNLSPQTPLSNSAISSGIDVANLDFNYKATVIGDTTPSWTPETVFNDGKKTYIKFPKNMQVAPTLFVGNGTTRMINYHIQGQYFIVDQVLKHMKLQVGQTDPAIIEINYVKEK